MKISDIINKEKIYAIIREDDKNRAYEIAKAYIEGGIKVIEFNCPYDVTKKIHDEHNNILISQGGIITTAQAQKALCAGAKIISSPILQSNLIRFASCYSTFLIPTATTPNEAYSAWKSRIALIKIYPVDKMGGIDYIKELIKPMHFLNLLPCGYVKLEEIKGYLDAGAKAVGVGRGLYQDKGYNEIVQTVKEVIKSIN